MAATPSPDFNVARPASLMPDYPHSVPPATGALARAEVAAFCANGFVVLRSFIPEAEIIELQAVKTTRSSNPHHSAISRDISERLIVVADHGGAHPQGRPGEPAGRRRRPLARR